MNEDYVFDFDAEIAEQTHLYDEDLCFDDTSEGASELSGYS